MKKNISFLSGLAGALVLTGFHQLLKNNVRKAPRLDKLGMQALEKTVEAATGDKPDEATTYNSTLVGDIVGNAAYFSMIRLTPEHPCTTGTALGVLAGVGAIMLPEKLGLDASATNASIRTKVLTVALYTAGGLISGLVYKWAKNNNNQ
ncbi:MAG: hypothetical protein DI535_16650 [Citrobacter freundii]|nr:MAG: hypothetical protein DI535_16650 [Citrobacter freundii]